GIHHVKRGVDMNLGYGNQSVSPENVHQLHQNGHGDLNGIALAAVQNGFFIIRKANSGFVEPEL
ncbi:MAG: hypothetical protein Q7U40_10545, partial [Desulfatirhabdiaceae bacterium]|nr:hypothetical protein [Desulfatirhabdiaceae bacterium]